MALVVFAALIMLSLLGLGSYLVAGHSWNVAASNIDDTFGSMEGYTAIVYAGTVDPEGSEDAEGPADLSDGQGEAGPTPHSTADGASDGEGTGPEPLSEAETPSGAEADTPPSSTVGQDGAQLPLSVDDVKESYEKKGATAFSLSTLDPSRYEEGVILKRGSRRFGVLAVTGPASPRFLERQAAYFDEHAVDFVVAIVSDREHLEGIEGFDIVISTQDEGLFVMGETIGSTFYVSAPELGKAGAILISPSNVVSAKVVEGL